MFVYLIVYNLFTLCISCIDKIEIKVSLLSECAKHFLLFTLTCRNIFFLFTLTCRDAPKLYEPPFTCIYAITYCVGHECLAGSLPDETDRPTDAAQLFSRYQNSMPGTRWNSLRPPVCRCVIWCGVTRATTTPRFSSTQPRKRVVK